MEKTPVLNSAKTGEKYVRPVKISEISHLEQFEYVFRLVKVGSLLLSMIDRDYK